MINTLNRQIIGTGGGGASASIYVTGLQESDSVTMTTPSGGTVVGVWDEVQGENCFVFYANEYGLHTITASNGVKTSTEEVLVDALMDYWVEMDYYTYLYRYGSDGFNSSHRFTGWNAYTRVDSVNTLTGYAVTALSNQYSLIQSDTKISVQAGQKLCVELNTSAINKRGAESRLALSSVQDYGVSNEVQVAGDLILSVGTQVQSMIVNSSGSYYVSVPIFSATTVVTKIWLE